MSRSCTLPSRRTGPRVALAGVLALMLAGCGGRAADDAAEKARLMQTSRDWSRAAAAGNVEETLGYWADDALVLSPGEATLRGKTALRAYLERSRKVPGFQVSWEPLEASLSDDGGMGYLVERTSVTVTGPDGAPLTQQFRGVTIWRKQPDGAWKNVVDISNAPPAARPKQ